MTYGVVAAVAPELRATLRALHARRRRAGGQTFHLATPFVFARGGIGPERAARCAARLLEQFHPKVLVSTGFAGALVRDLETGTIIVGGVPGLAAAVEALREACAADPRARVGSITTAERVLFLESEKESAFRATGAVGVDMEAAALGRLARERGVGFLCVKAVLDTPGAPLAARYESPHRLLREIALRPSVLIGVLGDARRARTAGRRLADFYRALAAVVLGDRSC